MTDKNFKNILVICLIAALVIVLLLKKCGNNSGGNTIIERDTIYQEVKGDISYVPQIDTVFFTRTTTKLVPYATLDTLYLPELIDVDTAAILSDYYKARVYRDSVPVRWEDKSDADIWSEIGSIYIYDTISQNRIKGRQVKTVLSIPEVTKTITLTQPKRAMVFLGANFLGSMEEPLLGYNVNLSFKTKRDKFIEAGYNQFYGGQSFYSLGLKFKISFRKQ